MSRIEGPGGGHRPEPPKGPAKPSTGPSFDEVMKKQVAPKPLGTGSPRDHVSAYPVDSPDREDNPTPSRARGPAGSAADEDAKLEEKSDKSEREPVDRPAPENDDAGAESDSDSRRDSDRGPKERAPIEAPRFHAPQDVAKASGGSRLSPEIYHRVVEAARMVRTQSGGQELQLALRAPGYEGMNLRLSSNQGNVRATFVVERVAQKESLEAELPALKQRLQAEGITVQEIQVELRPSHDATAGGDARQDRPRDGQTKDDRASGAVGGAAAPKSPPGSKPNDEDSTEYTL